jgi:hypothetical protein
MSKLGSYSHTSPLASPSVLPEAKELAATINLGWGDGTLMKQTDCRTENMQRFEKIRNAITMLRLHGYMPQSQSNKLREKLMREINGELAKAHEGDAP